MAAPEGMLYELIKVPFPKIFQSYSENSDFCQNLSAVIVHIKFPRMGVHPGFGINIHAGGLFYASARHPGKPRL